MNVIKRFNSSFTRKMMMALTGLGLLFSMVGCSAGSDTITIGGKDFAEQAILSNMMKLLVENDTDLNVELKTGMAANITWEALKEGDIDGYVEYTGTGLINILKHEPVTDPKEVYNIVAKEFPKKYGISWLKPIGFSNTYVVSMRKDQAEELGIKTVSDLAAKSDQLIFGTGQEWLGREDGFPAFEKTYNVNFKKVVTMTYELWYPSIENKEVDVIIPYSTEGKLSEYDLVLLEDDKHLFPPYDAVPIFRDEVLKEHPELEEVLNKLSNQIDETEMQKLNAKVEIGKEDPAKVAEDWLKEKGLIQ
ncbi:glycine betaine ABC transporter substrate-binding protein [Niallia oryzisoli]|uniref:Glycine betaine ABC transporter substrate-binding protein n=1 Tax=Niallia oryzisoli TaxID=1737571 RepID=A0ABZ2CFX7_9BACI